MIRLLREPLFHFFVFGAVLFGLFAIFDDAEPPAETQTINVTEEDVQRLAAEFQATWRRVPSDSELANLIDHLVREEVYVREALALGLDQNDAIIRRRLHQKMEFLTEAGAETVAPDEDTLRMHLAAHPDRFSRAALVGLEQVLLEDNVTPSRVSQILADLNAGADPLEVTRGSLLPPALPPSPRVVIDGSFGTGFFDLAYSLPTGQWDGPVESTFGLHLVRVYERQDGAVPPLEQIRDRVLQDWRVEFTASLREERFEAMRSRYRIERPEPAEVAGE